MRQVAYILIGIVIGYILGVLLPCNVIPEIREGELTRGEFFYYTVTAIGVLATICTVILALFKEDLLGLFKRVKLKFKFSDEKQLREETEDIKGTKKAIKYYSTAIIENLGNIHAENCELYIDRITYDSGNKTDVILTESKPVTWIGKRDRIYIPPKGKTSVHLFELFPPQQNSTPDGKANIVPAELRLLGHTNICIGDGIAGEWKCYYSIHSSSMLKPMNFETHIKWNGEWEHRLSEMSKNLQVELVSHE